MTAPDLGALIWRKSSRSGNQATCVELAYSWRKSSRSGNQADCVELAFIWLKSSHSTEQADCVELGTHPESAAIRDSKNPTGPMLSFTPERFVDFLSGVKAGRFDL